MRISRFYGITPRVPGHELPLGSASEACDVDLRNGAIKPWRSRRYIGSLSSDSVIIEPYGCCFFAWDRCVSVARGLPSCPRLYITGREEYPELAEVDLGSCDLQYWRLGVPNPELPVQVSYTSVLQKSKLTASRSYVYTYINRFGQEGGPSPASAHLSVDDGTSITTSGWQNPSAEWGVTHIRLYRTASGLRLGTEKEQEHITSYRLVAEFPVTIVTYTDDLLDRFLGEELETRESLPPPSGLRGITAISVPDVYAGFEGNRLYFSREHEPWDWPHELEVTLDEDIVCIGSDGEDLFVATTGAPYVISGVVPSGDRPLRVVSRKQEVLPAVACGHPHSHVMTPSGMVYASDRGLVLISRSEHPRIISEPWFSSNDWGELRPDTIRIAWCDGYLFFITCTGAYIMLFNGPSVEGGASLTTVTCGATDIKLSDSGKLLLLDPGGDLYQWGAGAEEVPYKWVSAPIISSRHTWYSSGVVHVSGSVEFKLEGENSASFIRVITGSEAFRLPRLSRNREHYITLSGTGEVTRVHLGETFAEVAMG